MAYGVIYGPTGSFLLSTGRVRMAISSIESAKNLVVGKTKDTFVVGDVGLHLIDLEIRLLSPTNIIPFTIELFNLTDERCIQKRNSVVPGHPLATDRHFGFDWMNESADDEYAFFITAQCGGFALLTQDLNLRAVVQMFR